MDSWRRPRHFRLLERIVPVLCAFALAGCAHRIADAPAPATATGTPYAGLTVNDSAQGGAVVVDLIAGPAALAGLQFGDRIVAVSGEPVDAAHLVGLIGTSAPGARLPLRVVRGERTFELDLVVGDRGQWAAPSFHPARIAYVAPPVRETSVWLDEVVAGAASAAPELDPVAARIERMFDELARHDAGFNKLPLVRRTLADPGVLVEWEQRLVRTLQPLADLPGRAASLLCESLALDCPSAATGEAKDGGQPSLAAFAAAIAAANGQVRAALSETGGRPQAFADLRYLLQETASRRTLLDRPQALRGIRAMQLSQRIDSAALLDAFARLIANAAHVPVPATPPPRKLPSALAALVSGDILDFAEIDGGYVVVGGPGANHYAMEKLYAVIDTGGDDFYSWGDDVPLETQTVIDVGGDDRYEARVGGPGAGLMGVSVLFDMAGNDAYVSRLGGCGAGAYGFGLLLDAGGVDHYACDAWSVGAGIYGGGILADAGSEADVYLSQVLSQGVGGPGGAGLLVDAGGEDLYRANGPVGSAYGTPAVFMAFSQGVGFGIRPYDHGGIGALVDLGGNDRYEGGEFSQGGGYFWGMGLLHDAAGNDFYYGNRYAQGFACHQAAGLLTDLAGDDVYWAMHAAAQAAAWDQSVAMLFDGGGNDVYRAETLAQGAAAQQSRAFLYDAGGDDDYRSPYGSAQGAAADNSYHFRPEDPIVSLGVLLDAAGADRYTSGLEQGGIRIRHVPDNPGHGNGNAGIAIDRAP